MASDENVTERTCAYCGKTKCPCRYRAGRLGKNSMTMSNTSRETTCQEMLNSVRDYFRHNPERRGAWSVSFTTYSDEMIAKADAKREAKEMRDDN